MVIVILHFLHPDSLTVDDINNSLDLMAQSNAEGRRDITKKEIQKVIRNTSALEQKWLIRIMLKVFFF